MKVKNSLAQIAILGLLFLHYPLEANATDETVLNPAVVLANTTQFHSQASQDRFVYTLLYRLLGKQDKGYYLEIGAADPLYINNTYFFEHHLLWDGISIDISPDFAAPWHSARKNPLLSEDATRSDYSLILQNFPHAIDYLSLDIDENYDLVLKELFRADHIFKVITIEHDAYRFGDLYKGEERRILTEMGYHLLCSDVLSAGLAFEDWWVHPDFFSPALLATLSALDLQGKSHRQLIRTLENFIKKTMPGS